MAALNPNGSLDRGFSGDGRATFAFGNGGNADQAEAVAVARHGKLALAGLVVPTGATSPDFGVLRLNRNGTPDRSFSDDGRQTFDFDSPGDGDVAEGVAFQPHGKLVVGGFSHQGVHGNEIAVARLTGNGNLDPTFSEDGRDIEELSADGADDDVNAMAVQRNGRILLAGDRRRTRPPASTSRSLASSAVPAEADRPGYFSTRISFLLTNSSIP